MAIRGGDGSIILTTNVDESGLKKGMQQANKFVQMSTNEQRRMAQSLSKVYRQQGMSQSEAQKKAWHDLKNNTVATKDLAKATEDVAKKTEQATKETKEYGETAKRSGTIAKNTFLAVGKAFLTIGVASAAAIVAMTKQAVSAYADYEQLVGGVETLFKDSAQKVIDYAEDAFYTAGISANEYMKQVTSFSASLIRSTAGDTEKAADIANMALVDISDNANKMGSTIESITLAYQGFAKQQYMLLDNLKLGYGGTKGEMERLLKDAQAITGIEYNINNLADVYSAIHVIQEELGIAGTTAKEAEKTISGSANMMKASWKNVLAAISGGGDIDKAINNLVYSVQRYFENIVPVIQRSLVGIGQLIESVAPLLIQNLASALIRAIPDLINAVYQMIIGLAKGIIEGVKALFTGGGGSITANIKTSMDEVSSSIGGATSGMENLGDATEEAGKKAKKALAGFDDLQILTENAGTSSSDLGNILPGGSSIGSISSEIEVIPSDDKTTTFLDVISEKLTPIKEAFLSGFWEGFEGADFSKPAKSLDKLKKTLVGFADDPEIIKAYENLQLKVSEALGVTSGTAAKIAEKTATAFIDGFDQYLNSDGAAKLKDSTTKAVNNISDTISSSNKITTILGEIFTSVDEKTVSTTISQTLELVSEALAPAIEIGTKFGADVVQGIELGLEENQPGLEEAAQNTAEIVNQNLGGATTVVGYFGEKFTQIYNDHISPFVAKFSAAISSIVKILVDGYNQYLAPTITKIGTMFSNLWENNLKPMFDELGINFGLVWDDLVWLWDTLLKPFLGWCTAQLMPGLSHVLHTIAEIFNLVIGAIAGGIQSLTQIFNGLIIFLKGVFSGDWEQAWEGLKQIFYGILNGMITGVEFCFNKIIMAINSVINGLSAITTAIGEVFDQDWNIPNIEPLSFPRLAQGAVIPPNREFLAVLGDQKQGVNIEAPLQTIVDAFNIALAQNGGSGRGNTEVVLEIDGREFGRAVVEQGNRENRRIGTRLVIA